LNLNSENDKTDASKIEPINFVAGHAVDAHQWARS
jgi:hypothetical protein